MNLAPDRAADVWEALWREAKQHCPPEKFLVGLSIAYHGKEWVDTGNPFHVDAAVVLCGRAGIQPLPSLMTLIQEVAQKRLNGDVRAGTPGQIMKASAKDFALNLMTNLCAADVSREDAASKSAQQAAERWGSPIFKASSLDKFYSAKWRKLENDRRRYFATEEGAPALAEWKRIAPLLPDADEELRGDRR